MFSLLPRTLRTALTSQPRFTTQRFASTTSLTQIEARWSKIPQAEQGALSDTVVALQQGDWREMTLEQKRAAYYIAYGAYGPRGPRDPTLQYRVFGWVAAMLALSYVLWLQSDKIKPKLITQTPEWKAAEDALMIERKMNPYSGPYAAVLAKEAADAKK